MSEQLTHWKKNNDPKYISGEDLKDGIEIGKGLQPEMVVTIAAFEDKETFDQNNQSKVMKTGLWLQTLDGKRLYKPMILNNTNAAFWLKETGSKFMEHWLNKPAIVWAMPDKRHGFVARFKKYYPPVTITDTKALTLLNNCTTLEELANTWKALTPAEQKLPTVLSKKETMKEALTAK